MANELIFTHPNPNLRNRKLVTAIKPDQITWSYGLNTITYPTYGGEVVQILSCYIDDMTIAGTTRNYHQLERIYRFFIDYIQIATQKGNYDPRPIKMHYPHRQWTFDIHPKGLVKFSYDRDITAPVWTVVAAVAEPDQDLTAKIMDRSMIEAVQSDGNFKLFGTVTGNIGYEPDDPFRTPFVDTKKPGEERRTQYGKLADRFNKLIPAYMSGDFDDLSASYSRPVFGTPDVGRQAPGRNAGTRRAISTASVD